MAFIIIDKTKNGRYIARSMKGYRGGEHVLQYWTSDPNEVKYYTDEAFADTICSRLAHGKPRVVSRLEGLRMLAETCNNQ